MKRLYSSPDLQRIWNHSLETVQVTSELCKIARFAQEADAKLAGLMHDIGQLALAALGEAYQKQYAALVAQGWYPVEIERRLCGSGHAAIGANLLEDWGFPSDLIDAIRFHHSPSESRSPLTSVLFLAECWTDNGEDVYDPVEHRAATDRLGIQGTRLNLGQQRDADLDLLRFAA